MKRWAGVAVLVLLAGISISAEPFASAPPQTPSAPSSSAAQAPSPTFTLGVDDIEVDTRVTDKQGNFVRGLTQKDFQIFEDGKPQAISAFSVVDMPAPAAARPLKGQPAIQSDVASNAQPFTGRLYVMLIDDLHTDPGQQQRARDAARRFVEQDLGPDDLMAVVHTVGSLDATQPFTSNKAALLSAIGKTDGASMGSATLNVERGESGYSVDQRQLADANAAYDALRTLAGWLGQHVQNRRKAILFVSEGVDYDVRKLVPNAAKIAEENMSPGSNVPIQEFAGAVLQAQQAAIDAARANNVAIYGIDPQGGADKAATDIEDDSANASLSDEVRLGQDSLRTVSGSTGGFAIVDSNNFNAGYRRIVAENSSYYVLAYYPRTEKHDGKFHRIEVRVDRPDVTVTARQGYLAPKLQKATATGASAASSMDLAQALNSPLPVSGLMMHVFAAPFEGGPSSSESVLIGAELRGADLALTEGDQIQVGYVALDGDGRIRARHTSTVMLNAQSATRTRIAETGVRLLNRLALPPGHYELRVAAYDEGSGRAGSVVDTLDVPDFGTSPLALSGVVLTSSTASSMPTAQPDPALQAVMPAPPAALRTFPQSDTVALYAEAYDHHAGQTVGMKATVTDSTGKVVFDSTDAPQSSARPTDQGAALGVRVPMKELSPGRYLLTVTARAQAAGIPPATREIPFTVVSAPLVSTASVAPATAPPAVGPCCSQKGSYEADVRAFAYGDRGAASVAIGRAPADQLKRAVSDIDSKDQKLLEAASVMHLALGLRAMGAGFLPEMRLQLQSSESAFKKIRQPGNGPFAAAWYRAAVALHLSAGDFEGAMALVHRGLGQPVPQGALLLAGGIVAETQAEVIRGDPVQDEQTLNIMRQFQSRGGLESAIEAARIGRGDTGTRDRKGLTLLGLSNAEKAYRQALDIDSSSEETELRLGRVLSLEGKDGEAQTTLWRLVAASHDQRVLYLAHLFLADLATRRRDSATAVREYQAALALNPLSRIALIGLSNLALLTGDQAHAAEYIQDWSFRNTAPPNVEWTQYEDGLDQLQSTLNVLLQMISR